MFKILCETQDGELEQVAKFNTMISAQISVHAMAQFDYNEFAAIGGTTSVSSDGVRWEVGHVDNNGNGTYVSYEIVEDCE